MSLNFYINLVRRWLWLLVLAPLVAGVTTYWVNRQEPSLYQASARLVIGPGIDSPNPSTNDLRAGGQLMHTYAQVATTRPFLQAISDSQGLNLDPDKLVSEITVTPNDDAQILTIRVQDRDPVQATTIANAVAGALIRLSPFSAGGSGALVRDQMRAQAAKLQSDIDSIEARIKQLEADYEAAAAASQAPIPADLMQKVDAINALLDTLEADLLRTNDLTRQRLILDVIAFERSRLADLQNNDAQVRVVRDTLSQLVQERTRLDNAHQTLALLQDSLQSTSTNQVKLLEPAATGRALPSQIQLKILMGSAAGFIVAMILATAAEYFDDLIRTAEDLTQAAGVPVLGTVSKHTAWLGRHRKRLVVRAMPTSRVAEGYRLLSTKLLLSNPNAPASRSVLISSVQGEDNTSEIAANVAATLAQTGARVILVDANLRRPIIAQLFDIGQGRGLTDALANPSEPPELVTFDWAPRLSVLPGDPAPSDAFELLASPRMVNLIGRLKGQTDILIIAAAPLLAHADSLILASHVDSVLFVARKGVIRRKVINHAMEHLRSLGAHVVGIVFNDSRRTPVHVARHPQTHHPVSRSSGDALAIWRSLGARMMSAVRSVQGLKVFRVRMLGKFRRNGRYTAGLGVSSEPVTIVTADNGSGDQDAMAHQPANPNADHPTAEDASFVTADNGSGDQDTMAHQPANSNADHPTAEDASLAETVVSVPTTEGEMSGDSSLTRPADDTAGAQSAATASLSTR
jgi:capsular exopolysaccharide synthesis family protein